MIHHLLRISSKGQLFNGTQLMKRLPVFSQLQAPITQPAVTRGWPNMGCWGLASHNAGKVQLCKPDTIETAANTIQGPRSMVLYWPSSASSAELRQERLSERFASSVTLTVYPLHISCRGTETRFFWYMLSVLCVDMTGSLILLAVRPNAGQYFFEIKARGQSCFA